VLPQILDELLDAVLLFFVAQGQVIALTQPAKMDETRLEPQLVP
jgi:hypothetical protein